MKRSFYRQIDTARALCLALTVLALALSACGGPDVEVAQTPPPVSTPDPAPAAIWDQGSWDSASWE